MLSNAQFRKRLGASRSQDETHQLFAHLARFDRFGYSDLSNDPISLN